MYKLLEKYNQKKEKIDNLAHYVFLGLCCFNDDHVSFVELCADFVDFSYPTPESDDSRDSFLVIFTDLL